MTVLVLRVNPNRADWWLAQMRSLLPEIECRLWEDAGNPDEVDIAVVWKPPPGGLKRFKNLSAIISIGAGIDHVLADPELPRHVPIIRTTSDDLRLRMREYVLLHVLRLHRRLPELEKAAKSCTWQPLICPPAHERCVGVMGLGHLGLDCAMALHAVGFQVRGWSRRPKEIDGIDGFAGDDDLKPFLEKTEILVCLLPLTPATRHILNADLFSALPKGASVINAARGGHLMEQDLLDALDQDHLSGATLDVFDQEPLPPTHIFWQHPKILVTPHVGSLIDPAAGGKAIAENVRNVLKGAKTRDWVDRHQGY